jgi:hypothetical protein
MWILILKEIMPEYKSMGLIKTGRKVYGIR